MRLVEWKDVVTTGDAVVDEQHRDIYDLLNGLRCTDDSDFSAIIEALDRLATLAPAHFAAEEKLMGRISYPEEATTEHKMEHVALIDKANRVSIDYRRGWVSDTGMIVKFLNDWITDHIATRDRELADYMQKHRQTS